MTGFETRPSGSAEQHPNHYTTEAFNRAVSHYKYNIGYRCKVLYMLTLVEHHLLGVEDAGADLVHGADLANWAADLVDVEDAGAGADAVHGAGLVDLEDL